MKINWFPGHMTKALRMIADELKNIDVIIYVLDSRAPFSSENPALYNLIGKKPILYVLNKYDLADSDKVEKWKKYFTHDNCVALSLNSTESGALPKITKHINSLCQNKIENYKRKGVNIVLKAMVIGIPNSGKSTLVNNLCGMARAITGNKPGVTKGKQWVKLSNNIEVLDTPGTLWPSLENQVVAKNLAYIGSIKDEVLDKNELALELIGDLVEMYPNLFTERYNVDIEKSKLEILEDIAFLRKYVLKGNECDYDRTCNAILDDFRKGRIGKITLEEPK